MHAKQFDVHQMPRGFDLLRNSILNKGTAFTEQEREAFDLQGLLPPRVHTQEEQLMRVLENLRRKSSDLEKYIFLTALQDRNESLFTRLVMENLEETLPIIYTPTVGKACQEYGHIYRRPRGMFLASKYKGRFRQILNHWPERDIRVIVVTDGERILGLGDLGADGMGIPIGKLSLYTACAGIHPAQCLPVTMDVGTESEDRLKDPLYIGMQQRRLRGDAYDEIMDEFMDAVQEVFPNALIQFEDFGNRNAFRLLSKYRHSARVFNDDIQGTAAVALGGIYGAMRMIGGSLRDQTFLFLGAGEAGTGIGELTVRALKDEGLSEEEARRRCWFVDSHGLVVRSREGLAEHKRAFAHEHGPAPDFLSAVHAVHPTAIIGVSGQPGTFDRAVLESMAEINDRPIVFALSNPTDKSECTPEDAYTWTGGRAVFASGSPFKPVQVGGGTYVPGQGNNVYVFPGVGLAVTACRIRRITDEMFAAAARSLAGQTRREDLDAGCVYPPLATIRSISLNIAVAVAEAAFEDDLADMEQPQDLAGHIESCMFDPRYQVYV
jgi:malate dehydrogenase (oxaloacetate-decarboxylating)(NADP+)